MYYIFPVQIVVLNGNIALGCGPGTGSPKYMYFNVCYNERGFKTNYVHSALPHCMCLFRTDTVATVNCSVI